VLAFIGWALLGLVIFFQARINQELRKDARMRGLNKHIPDFMSS